jgi:hypothetical protein
LLACSPLDPRFAASNPAEAMDILRAIKCVARLPSSGKYSRRPHVVSFYGTLKNLAYYDRNTTSAEFKVISRQLPALLLDVSGATKGH